MKWLLDTCACFLFALCVWGLVWLDGRETKKHTAPYAIGVPPIHMEAYRDYYGDALADAHYTFKRLGALKQCERWVPYIARESVRQGISASTIAAIIFHESSCNPFAVSHAGAVGLMGVHANTWAKEFGWMKVNPFDPASNIRMGTKILLHYFYKSGNMYDAMRKYYGVTEGSSKSHEYAAMVTGSAQ